MIRLFACLLAALTCLSARAGERILDFRSEIEIAADATMTVAETIRVRAEGNRIRRGIYRDFPTDYRDRNGHRVNVAFVPISVTRDGKPEPWRAERHLNGVRVYFGDADVLLAPGEYVYEFRYRSTRQLGFFEDHDELYWNVTGNGWEFTIDHAAARVTLPDGVARSDVAVEGYTGLQGSTARDYRAGVDDDGRAWIETTSLLPPRMGLTVVVTFPKGVVAKPGFTQRLGWFGRDNRREAALAIGTLLLAGFLLVQWLRVGRDPKRGTIVAEYDPPDGLSPAAARYVWRMEYDDRCFAADAVELAVRGAWRIDVDKASSYTLRRSDAIDVPAPGSAKVLFRGLLGKRDKLKLASKHHATIAGARRSHESFLADTFGKPNFRRNDGIGCIGGVLALLFVLGCLYLDPMTPTRHQLVPAIAGLVLVSLTTGCACAARARHREGTRGTAIGYLVGAALLGAASGVALWFLARTTSLAFAVLVAVVAAIHVLFAFWMRAPTVAGRRLLDRIEGLRLYLGVAERDDLARAKAPPMTADEYQRLLPYAIALNVEETWGSRLADAIGPAAAAAAAAGMAWYHDNATGSSGFDPARFGSSLGSSFAGAISSSSSPPGSSSGSSSGGGGGGSSGGGGGGGGGGGW